MTQLHLRSINIYQVVKLKLENRDNVKEANPVLGESPNNIELISLKLLILPFIHQNSSEHAMVYFNTVTTLAVINNLYVINRYD